MQRILRIFPRSLSDNNVQGASVGCGCIACRRFSPIRSRYQRSAEVQNIGWQSRLRRKSNGLSGRLNDRHRQFRSLQLPLNRGSSSRKSFVPLAPELRDVFCHRGTEHGRHWTGTERTDTHADNVLGNTCHEAIQPPDCSARSVSDDGLLRVPDIRRGDHPWPKSAADELSQLKCPPALPHSDPFGSCGNSGHRPRAP